VEPRYISVSDALARIPVKVGQRRFRETARALGLNRLDGRQMMVRPADIDTIIEAMTCSDSSRGRTPRSGKSMGPLVTDASAKALALLTELKPKKRARTSKQG
jgi:hypothetical protein